MTIRLGLAALLAAGAMAAPALADPARVVDPACLAGVAWEVDPTDGPIQVWGCRPAAEIPAPDEQGFVNYDRPPVDGTDAGFVRAKTISDEGGVLVFEVQDNGGGSGTFGMRVTGSPGEDGVLAKDGLKIDLLGGS